MMQSHKNPRFIRFKTVIATPPHLNYYTASTSVLQGCYDLSAMYSKLPA
jgi:hypothetical protein